MNLSDATEEARRLSDLLDKGLAQLRESAREYAEAEEVYRKAKAEAWLKAPEGTVPERDAWVNGEVASDRARRDLSDGLRQAALEAVRSRRAQLSALQSLLAAEREEAALARTGPDL